MNKVFSVLLTISFLLVFKPLAFPEDPPDSVSTSVSNLDAVLADALRCIKMTPQDLRFRDDYVDVDSFRLELLDKLMRQPLETISFDSTLRSDWALATAEQRRFSLPFKWSQYLKIRGKAFSLGANKPACRDMNLKNNEFTKEYAKSIKELPEPLRNALSYLYCGKKASDATTQKAFAGLTDEEITFIKDNFPIILLEDVNDEFKSPEELDSMGNYEEELAKKMIPYLSKIDINKIVEAGQELAFATQICLPLLRDYSKTAPHLESLVKNKKDKENDLILRLQTSAGEIIIGGFGSSRYSGHPSIIIDLGGDDEYNISLSSKKGVGSSIIIDLQGNDIYRSEGDFAYGSGFLGTGILVDLSGDDTYLTKSFSLGSGLFGVGMLVDEGGNDKYFGDTFTMGAGSFGMGCLIDMAGSDQYSGALYAQGFGFVSGMGALIDSSGNDSYFAGGRYKDILRYKDHYISLSQGFAYGLRPIMSGGIGILFDLSGNDVYTSDIFGQGSSYWWSLGTLMDEEGNDKYVSFQYAQGAGTHMTLGILEDKSGDDVYISHGVSQGCGHDLAMGMLWDKSGSDNYITYDLSQGAGSANGIGILLDESGDDGYYVGRNNNTQGFGDPRRDYGSIGILLDLSGKDRYIGNGKDSTWWTTPSKWGVGIDK
jgi:hypothetical protein